MMQAVLFAAALAFLGACGSPGDMPSSTDVVFIVESDPGLGLPGAIVFVGEAVVGVTNSKGRISGVVEGRFGEHLRVQYRCPSGYHEASPPKAIRPRRFEGVAEAQLPIEVTLRCKPEHRTAVFVIRAKGPPGLPVLLHGREVSRTNEVGVAHFSARGAPGAEYSIAFDTGLHPELIPQFPVHHRALDDVDDIFVVTQVFDVRPARRHRRFRRPRITKIE